MPAFVIRRARTASSIDAEKAVTGVIRPLRHPDMTVVGGARRVRPEPIRVALIAKAIYRQRGTLALIAEPGSAVLILLARTTQPY
jgi:hypothetical protein